MTQNRKYAQMTRSPSRILRLYRKFFQLPLVLRRGLALILGLAALFGVLLMHQAQITRLALDNAALEAETRYLRRQIAQAREQYLKSSDLGQLRAAAEAIGMVMPLEGQIVRVDVSRQNYVSFEGDRQDWTGEQSELELQRAMQMVGEYLQGEAGEGRTEVFEETGKNPVESTVQGQEDRHE